MTFIKVSTRSAQICKNKWQKEDSNISITIYPMIHIGNKEFYINISKELESEDLILVEGTGWKKKGKLYDLFAHRLNLVTQAELIYPREKEIKNIDMPVNLFRKHFFRLPIKDIIFMMFFRIYLWFVTIKYEDVNWVEELLSSLATHYKVDENTEVDDLLLTKRDLIIVKNLNEVINKKHKARTSSDVYSIGIVFGAGHIPAITKSLYQSGFRIKKKSWYKVIDPRYYVN